MATSGGDPQAGLPTTLSAGTPLASSVVDESSPERPACGVVSGDRSPPNGSPLGLPYGKRSSATVENGVPSVGWTLRVTVAEPPRRGARSQSDAGISTE